MPEPLSAGKAQVTSMGSIGAAIAWLAGALVFFYGGLAPAEQPDTIDVNPLRDAFFGDLHLHTTYSFDAYLSGAAAFGPDEAYRFAGGEVVDYLGQPVHRREPLDFLAITDHAESLGIFEQLDDPASALSRSAWGKGVRADIAFMRAARRDSADATQRKRLAELNDRYVRDYFLGERPLPAFLKSETHAAWHRVIDSANRNNRPGVFTTFIGYEWAAFQNGANLHRNVIFKGKSAPSPLTSIDSRVPENLWTWLEAMRRQGIEALAIPHNGNGSDGLMYDWIDSGILPMSRAYAERRQANEPLSELTQTKGACETHPLLSPDDSFADYEIMDPWAGSRRRDGRPAGSYLRDALGRGLVLQREIGINPFKYGFVGASDLHNGPSVSAQADFGGIHYGPNIGGGKLTRDQAAAVLANPNPMSFSRAITPASYVRGVTAGGLTGVWAESNTRESIYEALRRREVFATTGSKLKLRFFGGWQLDPKLTQRKDWVAAAYAAGVPMGGNLPEQSADAAAPSFALWAVKDARGANLDRVQVIKVWEQEGQQKEKIFDVIVSGGALVGEAGTAELAVVWRDPEFDPDHFSAYYLRVLEVPSPRWSTLLANEHHLPLPEDVPAMTQQRGWSSPIWYGPRHQR